MILCMQESNCLSVRPGDLALSNHIIMEFKLQFVCMISSDLNTKDYSEDYANYN